MKFIDKWSIKKCCQSVETFMKDSINFIWQSCNFLSIKFFIFQFNSTICRFFLMFIKALTFQFHSFTVWEKKQISLHRHKTTSTTVNRLKSGFYFIVESLRIYRHLRITLALTLRFVPRKLCSGTLMLFVNIPEDYQLFYWCF